LAVFKCFSAELILELKYLPADMVFQQCSFSDKPGRGGPFCNAYFLDADEQSVWLVIECYI
jgi:hypothetical protein